MRGAACEVLSVHAQSVFLVTHSIPFSCMLLMQLDWTVRQPQNTTAPRVRASPYCPRLDVLPATVSLRFLKMSLLVPSGQYPLVTMAGFPPHPA